jgi:UDP-N-acetyl-D-mannosaminuronate dehydrogenase
MEDTVKITELDLGEIFLGELRNKTARVGVVGLGTVGLPRAVALARAGWDVVGVDRNDERLAKIANAAMFGARPIPEPGLPNQICGVPADDIFAAGEMGFTVYAWDQLRNETDGEQIDVWIVCVSARSRKGNDKRMGPDYRQVLDAVAQIGALSGGRSAPLLVVLESLVGPGATRALVGETLQRMRQERTVLAAYSPPDSGIDPESFKMVSGTSTLASQAARVVYESIFTRILIPAKAEVVEASALVRHCQRVTIRALANEMSDALALMGISYADASLLARDSVGPFGHRHVLPDAGVEPTDSAETAPSAFADVADSFSATPIIRYAGNTQERRWEKIVERVEILAGHSGRSPGDAERWPMIIGVYGLRPKESDDVEDGSVGSKIAQGLAARGYTVKLFDDAGGSRPTVDDMRRCSVLVCVHGTQGLPTEILANATTQEPWIYDVRNPPSCDRMPRDLIRLWRKSLGE